MHIQISTPALLFPAISLLLLAYTNRFLGLANVIRNLHRSHQEKPNPVYLLEIDNLRTRMRLIQEMQFLGILSLILCTVCMFLVFRGLERWGELVFGTSLLLMIVSLIFSLVEIRISGRSLDLHLQDLKKEGGA